MMKIHEKTLKIDEKPIYSFDATTAKISLSLGNTKMGSIINWSTLPGNTSHPLVAKGRQVTSVTGTCSHNCSGCFKKCYARRSILQHHNAVAKPWSENTLMIRHRTEECFAQIDAKLKELNHRFYETKNPADLKYKLFRINTSGELENLQELEAWNRLAKAHPEIKFCLYTKNSAVVLAFFEKEKQSADNLTVNISQWHHTMDTTIARLRAMGARFNIFNYDDSHCKNNELSEPDKAYLQKLPHCRAVLADGSHYIKPDGKPLHCSECQRCYTKTCTEIAVYSH